MKLLLISLLFTSTASATDLKKFYPVLNDRVFFEGVYHNSVHTFEKKLVDQHLPGFQFREISISNVYLRPHCPNGCGPRSDRYIDQFGLATFVKYKAAMEKCLADGGAFEMITVAAGVFDTCKLKTERKTTTGHSIDYRWVADVPWGFAKYQTDDFDLQGELVNTDVLDLKEVSFGVPQ